MLIGANPNVQFEVLIHARYEIKGRQLKRLLLFLTLFLQCTFQTVEKGYVLRVQIVKFERMFVDLYS